MKATWNGHTIAESSDTLMVEGNHYFPPESVDHSVLKPSNHKSTCPWKGEASYYSVDVDGQVNPDAAWTYTDPKPEASHLQNFVSFWRNVIVSDD